MTTREHSDRPHLLKEAILGAGQLALRYFGNIDVLTVERKENAQDVVSRADRDVEMHLRERIAKKFPDDGIVGEEHGADLGRSGFVWVIDPIDGTSPFLNGLDHWCVSVAIQKDTETVAGAVFDPNRNELFLATRGGGARLNDRPLRIGPSASLLNGLCGLGASHRVPPEAVSRFVRLLLAEGGMYFRNGSGALMLAQVAAGRLAAYYEPHMNAWDCLAGLLIVREAGGWTLDFPGDNDLLDGGVVAASAPGGAEHLQSLIARSAVPAKG